MTVDTSAEALEQLAKALEAPTADLATELDCIEAAATLRALAAERDEERKMRLHAEGVAENNRLDVLRMAAERDALRLDFDLLMTDRERAEAERDAARAEVARLREALEEIERGHIPSMPMTEVVDELTWVQMWVGRLRKIARAALAGDPQP